MRYYYTITELDEYGNQVCVGTIDTFEEILRDNYIRTEVLATSLLGKVWTGKEWIENPNPPAIEEVIVNPLDEALASADGEE